MANLSESAVRQLVLQYWNPVDVVYDIDPKQVLPIVDVMVEIARLESGFNPNAHNAKPPDNSYGLWQINMFGPLGIERRARYKLPNNEALYDPATNARVAHEIWKESGMSARSWSTFKQAQQNLLAAGKGLGENEPVGTAREAGLYPGQLQVEGTLDTLTDWASGLANLLRVLLSASFWKRLGIGALGLLIVIGGALFIYARTDHPQTPVSTQVIRKLG